MLLTTRFDLDASVSVQVARLSGLTSGDRVAVRAVIQGFEPGDVIEQAAFTAKVALADLDTAPTTIQKILPSPDGAIEAVLADGTVQACTFELEPVDTIALLTERFYDVRLWVVRGGATYIRTVQKGKIVAQLGVTSLDEEPEFTGVVTVTQAGPMTVLLSRPVLYLEDGGLLLLQDGGSLLLAGN